MLDETAPQQLRVDEERRRLDFVELRMLVELLGRDQVSMERVLAQWVAVNVPQVIGGTDAGVMQALLQSMPMSQARDIMGMVKEALARDDTEAPELTNGSGRNGSVEH